MSETCDQCRAACAMIYGPDPKHLQSYMERQHKHCKPAPTLTPDRMRDFAAAVLGDFGNAAVKWIVVNGDAQPPPPSEATMKAFSESLRSPPNWFVRADPVSGPDVTTHSCARCGHAFTSKPDGFVDEALENEIAAHEAQCFVVGDEVRWQVDERWHEGTVANLVRNEMRELLVVIDAVRGHSKVYPFRTSFSAKNCRRIERPEQAIQFSVRDQHGRLHGTGCAYYDSVDADCTCEAERAATPKQCCICGKRDTVSWECDHGKAKQPVLSAPRVRVDSLKVTTPEPNCTINGVPAHCPPPAPALYDGLTAEQCYLKWVRHMPMDAEQIAVAKRYYAETDGAEWSRRLRARIDTGRERERSAVCLEGDPEDTPWR